MTIAEIIEALRTCEHALRLANVQIDGNPHEDVLEASEMTASDYKSQSARDAQAANYGDKSFWNYLDESAAEHYAKGIEDAYTQSLGDALKGNDGA